MYHKKEEPVPGWYGLAYRRLNLASTKRLAQLWPQKSSFISHHATASLVVSLEFQQFDRCASRPERGVRSRKYIDSPEEHDIRRAHRNRSRHPAAGPRQRGGLPGIDRKDVARELRIRENGVDHQPLGFPPTVPVAAPTAPPTIAPTGPAALPPAAAPSSAPRTVPWALALNETAAVQNSTQANKVLILTCCSMIGDATQRAADVNCSATQDKAIK